MPTYNYRCLNCCQLFEEVRSINDNTLVICTKCDSSCEKIILKAPGTIVPPNMRAVQSSNYYGKGIQEKSSDDMHLNFITENEDGTVTVETTNPNGPQFKDDKGFKEV